MRAPINRFDVRALVQRARRRWSASSFRRFTTEQELDHEKRLQDLLDQRWQRWQRMLYTAALSAGIVTEAIPIEKALDALLKAVGVP